MNFYEALVQNRFQRVVACDGFIYEPGEMQAVENWPKRVLLGRFRPQFEGWINLYEDGSMSVFRDAAAADADLRVKGVLGVQTVHVLEAVIEPKMDFTSSEVEHRAEVRV